MFENYRVVTVCPSGRRRYMKLLGHYLLQQKELIDEHHWWLNTEDPNDLAFCQQTTQHHPNFFKCIPCPSIVKGARSICEFFPFAMEKNTIYIRLDDDVVWMKEDALLEMLRFRIANPHFFLILGNIINNSLSSHLHQRFGCGPELPINDFITLDDTGWGDPLFAEQRHRYFLRDLANNDIDKYTHFDRWVLNRYERYSINAICWFGVDFAEFGGILPIDDEEHWLTVLHPWDIQRPNCIVGKTLFSHYAFFPTREHLDETDILAQYEALIPAEHRSWYAPQNSPLGASKSVLK